MTNAERLPPPAPATGVWFFPDQDASALVDAIVHAEAVGVDQVWLGDEGVAREPFTVLAAAATATTHIRLAIGVTNPYVRHPGIAIGSAATLSELSGGRFVLGVGAGGAMSLAPFGLTADRPVDAIRHFLEVARAARSGDAVEGYVPSDLAVTAAAPPVPVFVGARGPRLNTLASEIADGAFVAGLPPFRYDEVIGWARSVRPIDIALYPSVAFDDAARDRHRPEMIWSLLDAPPGVSRHLGVDPAEVVTAADALRSGDPEPATRLITDDLADQIMLTGPPGTVAGRLVDLVRVHRPDTIGLAVISGDLTRSIDQAAETFARMRDLLDPEHP